jgi:hypothetical protein
MKKCQPDCLIHPGKVIDIAGARKESVILLPEKMEKFTSGQRRYATENTSDLFESPKSTASFVLLLAILITPFRMSSPSVDTNFRQYY